jgi:hypothetical protein
LNRVSSASQKRGLNLKGVGVVESQTRKRKHQEGPRKEGSKRKKNKTKTKQKYLNRTLTNLVPCQLSSRQNQLTTPQ